MVTSFVSEYSSSSNEGIVADTILMLINFVTEYSITSHEAVVVDNVLVVIILFQNMLLRPSTRRD